MSATWIALRQAELAASLRSLVEGVRKLEALDRELDEIRLRMNRLCEKRSLLRRLAELVGLESEA